jgi:hypothetical protein
VAQNGQLIRNRSGGTEDDAVNLAMGNAAREAAID